MSNIRKVDCHGKTFVLSRVVGAERVAIVKYITEHGGEVTGNLDGKVDYLIYRFGGGEESIQFRRIEGKIGAGEEIGMLPSSVFRMLQGITYIGGYYDDEQEIALFYLSSSKEWQVDAKDLGWIRGYVFDRQMELAQILMDRDMVDAIARMMPMVEQELAILVEEGIFTPYEMVRRVDAMLSYANDHQCGAEVISWLLNYKNSHYDSALLEDAEADALDYELELRDSFLGERFPNATLPRDLKDEFHASDLQGLSVGSHVVLGLYPQGRHRVVMPIDWVVVAMEDHRALLVSRFYLYNHCYHEEYKEITWKDCSLRKNLNQDFYGRAFNPKEQEMILET
ncbi:MAG: BRCT domain-containing protein, partial [Lachnospiraceae bacterium]|nr:BRCT domain-containing protein [Lachnospiraceae bacterium]